MTGIYQIRNIETNMRYIGQSKNLSHRKSCHMYDIKNKRHKNMYLQNDYDNNPEKFVFEILCKCQSEDLDSLEKYFINKYKSNERKHGYNLASGGSVGYGIMPEESIKRMSISKMGNTAMTGRKLTEEWKRHISEAHLGKKPVVCVETGEVFLGSTEAAKKMGLHRTKIVSVCTGKRKTTGGFHFRYDK